MKHSEDDKVDKEQKTTGENFRDFESRRRFIKKAGTAGLAVPAITTLAGKDLLTRSARAQTPSEDDEDYDGRGHSPTI